MSVFLGQCCHRVCVVGPSATISFGLVADRERRSNVVRLRVK